MKPTLRKTASVALLFFAVTSANARADVDSVAQAIVGGEDATWPPTAMLGTCSATLLAPTLIVTAAHCLRDAPTEARFVSERVPITACRAHPEYGGALGHDIAYCSLAHAVSYEPAHVVSRCEAEQLEAGSRTLLVGYGHTDGTLRDERRERMVSVRVNELRSDGRELIVGDGEHGACHGDSGGSAYSAHDHDAPRLLGVISRRGPALDGTFARDCEGTTIVTAVLPHLAWLESASGFDLETPCSSLDVTPSERGCSLASDPSCGALVFLLLACRRRFDRRARFCS